MADDFVNNFGLLGQVLFKKRNDRWAREKLDEALSRELAKIAAQAGYEKEIAEMRERSATERTRMGEEGAEKRSKRSEDEAMARARFGAGANMENTQIAQEGSMARQVAGDAAQLEREKAAWAREQEHRAILAEIARRNSLAQGTGAAAQFADKVGDLDPELLEGLTGVRPRAAAGPVAGPTKTGRIKLGGGTPPKPGETPRNPDAAAPEIPVQVGPKPPTADVKFDSVSKIGTGLLENIRGNTLGVGPDSKNMQALVEAYLQKSNSAEPPSILDALGKELGYDQRRPAIKK